MNKTNIIKSRAPLRIGLAGGGSDLSPYCDLYGGYVLNATISRYVDVIIKPSKKNNVRFVSLDLQIEKILSLNSIISNNGKLDLHTAVYKYFIKKFNNGKPIPLELISYIDAPFGSGLGSSSTLVVAMVQAFNKLLNLSLDKYQIASIAYQIERVDCGLIGGRQDHYSASFGGFNFIEFNANEQNVVNQLKINEYCINELETSLILYFTGISRDSENIIVDQIKSITSVSQESLEAMHAIKKEALTMKECLLRGDLLSLAESLRSGWENKKRTCKTVSNTYIDKIYNTAIKAGALAGKVSGAGGGGFMFFFVPLEKRMNVIRKLTTFGGLVCNCHFTKHGAQAWKI